MITTFCIFEINKQTLKLIQNEKIMFFSNGMLVTGSM